jgi:hypothetical protein
MYENSIKSHFLDAGLRPNDGAWRSAPVAAVIGMNRRESYS